MINISRISVVGKSLKENEKRVPIHPDHIRTIPPEIRSKLTFEVGYGENFGVSDDTIAQLTSGSVAEKSELLGDCDCVIMPKPTEEELAMVKNGAVIWGWMHCVQQKTIVQIAIEKELTFISWEAMFSWGDKGEKLVHIFHKNNEIAGYASVNHAISLVGTVGVYGRPAKVSVLSFGSVSRGAVYALKGQGFNNISVFTERKSTEVANQIPGVRYLQMLSKKDGKVYATDNHGNLRPLVDSLVDTDIIVNGTLQDTKHPKTFVSREEARKLTNGTLIIDVSCDEDMGFWCAKPTSFENPMFDADGKHYYSVDHTPSFYWNSSSWEISKALQPFLKYIAGGEQGWRQNEILNNAVEIKNGKIINKEIINYQKRNSEYPYVYV